MIGILNCDLDESEDTNGAVILQRLIPDSTIINLVNNDQVSYDFSGFIITGSCVNLKSDSEWVKKLREIILEIHKRKIPCLGICFGMQIVAEVFEGKVLINQVNEKGFYKVNLSEDTKGLFKGLPDPLTVFQYHHDIVSEVPKGSEIISKNDCCIQGFVYDNFYCVQFHPEISGEIAKIMFERDEIDIESIKEFINTDYNVPQKIITNFVNLTENAISDTN